MAFGDILQTAVKDSNASATIDPLFAGAMTTGALVVSSVFSGDGPVTKANDLIDSVIHTDTGQDDGFGQGHWVVSADNRTQGWTQPSADQYAVINYEIEGPWEASPLDVTDTTAFADNPATMAAGPTATTAQNDEFVVAAWGKRTRDGASQTVTVDSVDGSFINLLNEDSQAASPAMKGVAVATKVLSATGTPTTTATYNGSSFTRSGALIATYKKEAAAPGGATWPGYIGGGFY